MKSRLVKPVMAACVLAIFATAVWGQRVPGVVDGEMWSSSAPEVRKAFLVGAGNMMALETAYAKKKGTPIPQASARTTTAISGLTLDQISDRITKWYETNPGRRDMPVMGVIWVDMVEPKAVTK